jgi:hypothetical protein
MAGLLFNPFGRALQHGMRNKALSDFPQSRYPSDSGILDGVLPDWKSHRTIGTSNHPDAALAAAVPYTNRASTATCCRSRYYLDALEKLLLLIS